jgi:hypothetical protein
MAKLLVGVGLTLKICGRRYLYAFFGYGLSRPLYLDVDRH